MNYRDYQRVRDAVWHILIDCQVQKLPVKVGEICRVLGVRLFSYEDAAGFIHTLELAQIIMQKEGLSFYNGSTPVILFDQTLPQSRKRFTAAHELGHIVLEHIQPGEITYQNRKPVERAANRFAVRLLAPACVLWGLNLHTPEEIAQVCDISLTAATFRAERMKLLYQRGKFLTSPLERQLYEQFSDFIGHRQPCPVRAVPDCPGVLES